MATDHPYQMFDNLPIDDLALNVAQETVIIHHIESLVTHQPDGYGLFRFVNHQPFKERLVTYHPEAFLRTVQHLPQVRMILPSPR